MHYNDTDPNHKESSLFLILFTGFILIGCVLMGIFASPFYLIIALVPLILFARALSPMIAEKIGHRVAKNLYLGTGKEEKEPLLSKAKAKELHHEYEEAVTLYMEIIKEFPTELVAYVSLFDILGSRLKDMKRLTDVHTLATRNIRDPKKLNHINRHYYEYKK